DAKAARMIASLRNLHVGKMPRREPEPWCRKIRNVNRPRVHIQHGGLRVAQNLPFITGRFAMRFLDLRKSSDNGRLWILDFGFWASLDSLLPMRQRLPHDVRHLRDLINAHES